MASPPSVDRACEGTAVRPDGEVGYQDDGIHHGAQRHGAGMAYQAISHASAIAVQDSVNHMRSVAMIVTAAIGSLTAKMVEKENHVDPKAFESLAELMVSAERHFQAVGLSACTLCNDFPRRAPGGPFGFGAPPPSPGAGGVYPVPCAADFMEGADEGCGSQTGRTQAPSQIPPETS